MLKDCLAYLQIRGVSTLYFSYFSMKTYVVGTYEKHLADVFLISAHSVCYYDKLKKHQYSFFETILYQELWSSKDSDQAGYTAFGTVSPVSPCLFLLFTVSA